MISIRCLSKRLALGKRSALANRRLGYLGIAPAVSPGSALSTDARRVFQGFSTIGQGSQDLNSNYNSLQMTLQRRFSGGLTLLRQLHGIRRVWTTCRTGRAWRGSLRRACRRCRGTCRDVTSSITADPISTAASGWWFPMPGIHPGLKHAQRLVRGVLGTWELTGIISAQTGGPLTVLAGRDAALTGLGTDRAQYLGGSAYGPGACKNIAPCVSYLNTAAFGVPANGSWAIWARVRCKGRTSSIGISDSSRISRFGPNTCACA